MLVIITEDSKSGYEFWKNFYHLVLNDSINAEVVIARPKNHIDFKGQNKNRGGIGNVRYELDYQIARLSKIAGHHLIFLAIDFVNNSSSKTFTVVKSLTSYISNIQIGRIQKFGNLNNINIAFSEYYCYEEIFLSFKYLLEFCGINNNALNKVKAKEIYNKVRQILCNNTYSDYLGVLNNNKPLISLDSGSILDFLYQHYKYKRHLTLEDMKNRECVASLCLAYISSVEKGVFFDIDKSIIGDCWFQDCFCERGIKPRNVKKIRKIPQICCKNCLVYKKFRYGSQKMGCLLTYSLFRDKGLIDINMLRQYI